MAQRISRVAAALKEQLTQAIAAIGALGPGAWPTSAPTAAALTTARDNINTSIIDTDAKADAWKIAAQLKESRVLAGVDLMKKVDDATDLLYGPSAAEKNNFGLPPKGAAIEPLHKLIQIVLKDGILPGSILADCENITGAAFEWQWAATSTFGSPVGLPFRRRASTWSMVCPRERSIGFGCARFAAARPPPGAIPPPASLHSRRSSTNSRAPHRMGGALFS